MPEINFKYITPVKADMPFARLQKKDPRMFLRLDGNIPEHIAFIMDGNRRYAQKKGHEAAWGHRKGMESVENLLHWAYLAKIKHITIYAFSTENFKRSRAEVDSIFELLEEVLYKISNDEKLLKKKISIRLVGETDRVPDKTVTAFKELEEKTAENDKMYLNVAVAYGGRSDIAQAFQQIAKKALSSSEETEEPKISDDNISKYLFPYADEPVPGVDLLIRTGEEHRTSNFLSWQANGSRAVVYFYDKYWPEFTFKDLFYLLRKYQKIDIENQKRDEKRLKKINDFLSDAQ